MAQLWRSYGAGIAQFSRTYRAVMAQLWRSYGAVMAQLWRRYGAVIAQFSRSSRKILVRGVSRDDEDASCGGRRGLVCEFRLGSRAVLAQLSWDVCTCAHGHVLHDLEHESRGFERMVRDLDSKSETYDTVV